MNKVTTKSKQKATDGAMPHLLTWLYCRSPGRTRQGAAQGDLPVAAIYNWCVRQALVAHQPPDDDSCLDLAPDEWQTSFRHLHQRMCGLAPLRTDRVLSDEVVLSDSASAARDYWMATRFQAYRIFI